MEGSWMLTLGLTVLLLVIILVARTRRPSTSFVAIRWPGPWPLPHEGNVSDGSECGKGVAT